MLTLPDALLAPSRDHPLLQHINMCGAIPFPAAFRGPLKTIFKQYSKRNLATLRGLLVLRKALQEEIVSAFGKRGNQESGEAGSRLDRCMAVETPAST